MGIGKGSKTFLFTEALTWNQKTRSSPTLCYHTKFGHYVRRYEDPLKKFDQFAFRLSGHSRLSERTQIDWLSMILISDRYSNHVYISYRFGDKR